MRVTNGSSRPSCNGHERMHRRVVKREEWGAGVGVTFLSFQFQRVSTALFEARGLNAIDVSPDPFLPCVLTVKAIDKGADAGLMAEGRCTDRDVTSLVMSSRRWIMKQRNISIACLQGTRPAAACEESVDGPPPA